MSLAAKPLNALLFSNIRSPPSLLFRFPRRFSSVILTPDFRVNRTRIFGLTSLAMIAFASNSLLCRAALKQTSIDAATFTFVRILSGVAVLWLIMKMRRTAWKDAGNWLSAAALFVYAATFSFAYNTLSAGMGALLLFGAVQATMILWGLCKGEKLQAIQIVGLVVVSGAITSGLGYVIWYSALPGLKAAGAATVQLSVPILAATGGILLLGEPITFRYLIASIKVLGGIALVVIEKNSAS